MARGITESNVHTAADELVAAGDRPTVDRIRAHLGTGSPNTVTRWLETWWQGLAPRLQAHNAQLALPQAPAAVGRLAQQLWEQALAAGEAQAQEALANDHAQLVQLREDLRSKDQDREARMAELVEQAGRAAQRAELAEQRLIDFQHGFDAQHAQIAELTAQRLFQQQRADRLEQELEAAQQAATERDNAWTTERDGLAAHVRSVEDRAHAEIDRARQECKEIRTQWSADQRAAEERAHLLRQQHDEAKAASIAAGREASELRGRAQALEQQLARLADLPAALEARLSQARGRTFKRGAGKAPSTGPAERASKSSPAPASSKPK